jgi:hypothetical protein
MASLLRYNDTRRKTIDKKNSLESKRIITNKPLAKSINNYSHAQALPNKNKNRNEVV